MAKKMTHDQRVAATKALIITAMKESSTNDPNEELAVLSEAFLGITKIIGEKVLGYTEEQNFPKMLLTQLINQI